MWVSGVARLRVVWAHRIGTKRFIVIYSRGAFATNDERRGEDKATSSRDGGWHSLRGRETSRFSQRRKNSCAESRACGTDASSADKAAALQKQAPSAKNTGGAYSLFLRKEQRRKGTEGEVRGVQVPRKDERVVGPVYTRDTRERSPTRITKR